MGEAAVGEGLLEKYCRTERLQGGAAALGGGGVAGKGS
jgi:hypothetical protein